MRPNSIFTNPRRSSRATTGVRKKGSHTNNYQVEFDVWYAFSEDEQRNYYYIHEEISCPFKNTYVGVYSKSVSGIAKVCEWFGRQVDVTFEPVSNANDVKIHRSSPTSTQSSQSYTSGFSWNLGGNVSYKFGGESAGATVGLSGGISVSNSHTYTVNDVTIADNGDNGSECKASWSFILSGVRTTYAPFSTACVNMYEGSLTGRSQTSGRYGLYYFDAGEKPDSAVQRHPVRAA